MSIYIYMYVYIYPSICLVNNIRDILEVESVSEAYIMRSTAQRHLAHAEPNSLSERAFDVLE